MSETIEVFEKRWRRPSPAGQEEPIFILSAGWRSGSTLLQRLVSSSGNVLLWGEPYDHCAPVQTLARSLTAIGVDYPPEDFLVSNKMASDGTPPGETDTAFWQQWIANLYPDPGNVWHAHRSFYLSLLRDPARKLGFTRWGLKEVRLTADHARYLAWLFPGARFLFLIRNPYDAYRSFRPHRGWYESWPDRPVFTPHHFGRHWRRLARSFQKVLPWTRAMLLRFEGLVSDDPPIKDISRFLGEKTRASVLDKKVGTSSKSRTYSIPPLERWVLRRSVEPLASQLGYESESEV